MTTKLQKWGNSLGVRLPKEVLKKAGLREGRSVLVVAVGESVIIKGSPTKRETFEDLVNRITPKNRHDEINWGDQLETRYGKKKEVHTRKG